MESKFIQNTCSGVCKQFSLATLGHHLCLRAYMYLKTRPSDFYYDTAENGRKLF